MLSDHRDDFIPRKNQFDEDNAYRELSNNAFMQYVVGKLNDDLVKHCMAIIEPSDKANKRSFILEIADEDLTLGYSFPSSRQSVIDDELAPITRLPLKSTPTRRYERLKSYNFTKDTVGFVRQQVPLLASLVCLLCPPESLSNVLEYTSSSEVFEQRQQDSGKHALSQTIGGGHVPPPKFREIEPRLSIDDESKMVLTIPTPIWQETFDKLSSLFDDGTPLKNFLISRLVCFKGILPWDRLIQEPLRDDNNINGVEDPAINLRTLPVLPGKSPELEHSCVFVLRKLLRNGLAHEALRFLRTEPVVNNRENVQSMSDLVLSSCFVNAANENNKSSRADSSEVLTPMVLSPVVLVYQLSDIELACRLVLSYIEVWPSDVCVQMLQLIHYRLPPSSAYVSIIDEYLYRLNIYQRIVELVEAPNPVTLEPSISPWTHWSQLVYDSKKRSDYVLSNLMKHKAFSLAREWARVHEHGDDITEVCLL